MNQHLGAGLITSHVLPQLGSSDGDKLRRLTCGALFCSFALCRLSMLTGLSKPVGPSFSPTATNQQPCRCSTETLDSCYLVNSCVLYWTTSTMYSLLGDSVRLLRLYSHRRRTVSVKTGRIGCPALANPSKLSRLKRRRCEIWGLAKPVGWPCHLLSILTITELDRVVRQDPSPSGLVSVRHAEAELSFAPPLLDACCPLPLS